MQPLARQVTRSLKAGKTIRFSFTNHFVVVLTSSFLFPPKGVLINVHLWLPGVQSHFNQRIIYITIALLLYLEGETSGSRKKEKFHTLIKVSSSWWCWLVFEIVKKTATLSTMCNIYDYWANDTEIEGERFLSSCLFSNKPIIFRYPCLNHLTARAVKGYGLHHQTILKMAQNIYVSTDSTPWA